MLSQSPPTLPQVSPIPSAPPTNPPDGLPEPEIRGTNSLSLSVVIPSYNRLSDLIIATASLYRTGQVLGQAGKLEILVQDDCSDTFDVMEVLPPVFCPARNAERLGFSGNCNAGAARAKGDILLFLNQDTKARDGWVMPLLNLFETNPMVGIVGPKLVTIGTRPVNREASLTPWVTGDCIQSCGGLYDARGGPYHRYLGYAADDWRVNVCERISWTTGAALAIRRNLFNACMGFDVAYELGYFEDVDLCQKAKRLGYEVWYQPESVFEHKAGSTGGIPPHVFRQNSLLFHSRWDKVIVPDTTAVMVNY